jgi:predicted dinucleotide-binding enzyme
MSKIAILGAGQVGQVLAKGFSQHGHEVRYGGRATFVDNAGWADVVVLAIKGTVAEAVVAQVREQIAGKVVIDATNPIADAPPVHGVLQYFTSSNESLMERLQKRVPAARFVKAFNSVGNAFMVNPKLPGGPPTMFICGNDAAAKAEVRKILEQFGWDTADMGMVESARAIEPLCMLWCIPGILQGSAARADERGAAEAGWMHAFKLLRA